MTGSGGKGGENWRPVILVALDSGLSGLLILERRRALSREALSVSVAFCADPPGSFAVV